MLASGGMISDPALLRKIDSWEDRNIKEPIRDAAGNIVQGNRQYQDENTRSLPNNTSAGQVVASAPLSVETTIQPPPSYQVMPAQPPPPFTFRVDFFLTGKQAQFLVNELSKTINLLGQESMVPPEVRSAELLDRNVLVSWFELERPETQAVYYRVLGLPIQKNTLLSRTKSEFFQMNKPTRAELKNKLQPIFDLLVKEISVQGNIDQFGVSQDALP